MKMTDKMAKVITMNIKLNHKHMLKIIAQHVVRANTVDACLLPLANSPLHILGNAPAFHLGRGGQDGEDQVRAVVVGRDPFLFKPHLHMKALQLMDVSLGINYVSRKPRDGFAENEIDLPSMRGFDHPQELRAFPGGRAGDPTIRIDAGQLPVRMLMDEGLIVIPLGFKALFLLLHEGADAGIRRNSLFAPPGCSLTDEWQWISSSLPSFCLMRNILRLP